MDTKDVLVEEQGEQLMTDRRLGLLINRNFALLWSGQVASTIGDYIFDTTLVLWIATILAKGQPWAPLAVGGVLIAASIPVFALGPFAGVFTDRWNKRRTMLWMDALRAVLIVLLLFFTGITQFIHLSVGWQLTAMYGTVLLASACGQFFEPSHLGLFGSILKEEEQAKASSLLQTVMSMGIIVGPTIGTLLFFALGVQLALVLNACSFVISFLTLLAIKLPREEQGDEEEEAGEGFWREFTEGIRFFAGNRVLTTLLIAGMIVVFGEGCLNILDIFFLQQNLHAADILYGFLGLALGAGLTLGALLAGLLTRRLGVTKTFCLGLLIGGASMLVYARMTSFFLALFVLFIYGVAVAAQNVTATPLVLHKTPASMIGRVGAVFTPLMTLASLLSVALASILDATLLRGLHATVLGISFGPVDSIFMAIGGLSLIAGIYAVISLRGVNPPVEEAEDTPAEIEEEGA